jgi:hypothetical protein
MATNKRNNPIIMKRNGMTVWNVINMSAWKRNDM